LIQSLREVGSIRASGAFRKPEIQFFELSMEIQTFRWAIFRSGNNGAAAVAIQAEGFSWPRALPEGPELGGAE
jgi:hypothetical protein